MARFRKCSLYRKPSPDDNCEQSDGGSNGSGGKGGRIIIYCHIVRRTDSVKHFDTFPSRSSCLAEQTTSNGFSASGTHQPETSSVQYRSSFVIVIVIVIVIAMIIVIDFMMMMMLIIVQYDQPASVCRANNRTRLLGSQTDCSIQFTVSHHRHHHHHQHHHQQHHHHHA